MRTLRRLGAATLGLLLLAPQVVEAQREVTPEARIFREYRDGVFTVFGDAGRGSGFLVDSQGLVLTNQHVVANSRYIRVQVSDSVKVAAVLLASDTARDVAVLRIHPDAAAGLPVLRIAEEREELAFEGERVIAIGSPLNQTRIVTSGIVSKVEAGAIISDVNINQGNSGGPLLNMDAEVIAINTFGDVSGVGGPGVSGSISIYEALPLLRDARRKLESAPLPPTDRLPVMPRHVYPLAALEHAARAAYWDEKAYLISGIVSGGTGNFIVEAYTPPYLYRLEKKLELELARTRAKREAAAGATSEEAYSPFEDLKAWGQYVGQYGPVVLLRISPRIGETTGSAIANIFAAAAAGYAGTPYRGSHKLEFKADLKDVTVLRGGKRVTEIQRGMTFVPLVIAESDYWASYYGNDLARAGVFVLEPELFAPDTAGAWPVITLRIEDLKKPADPVDVVLPRRTVERIWADFEPYREQRAADRAPLVDVSRH